MATVPESPATTSARRSTDYWIFLGAAIIASIVLRLIVNTKFQAPTILTDELTYSQLARDIADGKFSLNNGYGIVYPLLLAPSWVFNQFGTEAYTWMKATNAVLVSLTAIPVFFWAKRMMQPRCALLAAVLMLLMPSMAYSGHIMTENAFLLFFMLAVWAMAVAVERPTLLNQVLVVVAIVAAFATRAQAVVLLAALPLIILLYVLAEERATGVFSLAGCARLLLRFWPLAAIAGLGVLAIAVRTLATDWQVSQLLQAYSATTGGQYTVENVSRYFLWHLGEATFALGVIPVAALLLLVGLGILNRTRSSAERAYLATAIVAMPLVILSVAIFTSYWSQRVSERNMFCVFPIVLIGLALWFDAKLPRPTRTSAVAAAVAVSLVVCVPFAFLYQRAPSTETWGIVAPEFLSRKLPGGAEDVQVLIAVGLAVSLLLFGIARRSVGVIVIPVVLSIFLVVGQIAVVKQVGKFASDYRNVSSLAPDAAWVDRSIPEAADVAFLTGSSLGPDADRIIVWETGFFNRRRIQWTVWDGNIAVDPLTGHLTGADGRPPEFPEYVVVPANRQLQGDVIQRRGAYVLQRPFRPYALALNSSGVFPDGWTAASASIDVYDDGAVAEKGILRLTRPVDTGNATATITVGKLERLEDGSVTSVATHVATVDLSGGQAVTVPISARVVPFRVTIDVKPPFVPSQTGSPDTRQLGAQINLEVGSISMP